jgi:hypothetical protein
MHTVVDPLGNGRKCITGESFLHTICPTNETIRADQSGARFPLLAKNAKNEAASLLL